MNPDEQAILDLPPIPPAELVEKLVKIRAWSRDDPEVKVPLATFHLRSGRDVTGWVLTQANPRSGKVLTVQVADSGSRMGTVAYLSPDLIEVVTVYDARSVAHLLSDGKIPAPETSSGDAPTRLQLKRKLQELAGQLPAKLEVSWEGIPESGESLRALDRMLQDSVAVLQTVASDEMGREALGSLQQITLENGQTAAVRRDGQNLLIAANLQAGPAGRLTKDKLKDAIEKAL